MMWIGFELGFAGGVHPVGLPRAVAEVHCSIVTLWLKFGESKPQKKLSDVQGVYAFLRDLQWTWLDGYERKQGVDLCLWLPLILWWLNGQLQPFKGSLSWWGLQRVDHNWSLLGLQHWRDRCMYCNHLRSMFCHEEMYSVPLYSDVFGRKFFSTTCNILQPHTAEGWIYWFWRMVRIEWIWMDLTLWRQQCRRNKLVMRLVMLSLSQVILTHHDKFDETNWKRLVDPPDDVLNWPVGFVRSWGCDNAEICG